MPEKPPRVGEPLDIKRFLREVARAAGARGKFVVFAGNRFPKYLWKAWEAEMRRRGYTWQDLLRALSLVAGDVLDWAEGELEWERLTEKIWSALETTSRGRRAGRRVRRARSLEDYFR
ncbi:MAG: hypothetical protein F7C34_03840 [Desulfurococcales archaeon]|nr:hypothetical protein [Desulfurococcales archaeon]